MKILGLFLVATLLAHPVPARGEPEADAPEAARGSETSRPNDAAEGSGAGAGKPATNPEADAEAEAEAGRTAVDEEGDPLDEDDLVEVHGLVFEFFIEDDGKETQLAIEAAGTDYLVRGGGAERALAKQLGKTVTARGWTVSDESGDTWILVEGFQIEE